MNQQVPPTKLQREFIFSHVGYTPTPEQWAIHLDDARLKLVIGGERSGKSKASAMELLCWLIGREGLFWICGPDYLQCRPEFSYVLEALQKIGAVEDVSYPKVGTCSLTTVFKSVVLTKTADDVKKLAGTAPDGILLVEGAQTSWETWLKLRGRIAEKRGWLVSSGTLEAGADWYPSMWKRWSAANTDGGKAYSLPTWSNTYIFPGGKSDPEILALQATLPDDVFQERYGAVPCAPSGLVFREFSYQDHVREIVWRFELKQAGRTGKLTTDALLADLRWPVEVAVDPGYAHHYAVLAITWFGDQVFVFDEVAEAGLVAEDIIERCKAKSWWRRVKGGVIDMAGTQHPGSKSQQEIWRHSAGLHLRAQRVGVVEGILRLRTFLLDPATKQPRIWFSPKCKRTLWEFGKYRYHKSAEQRPISELPIDLENDCLKALGYWTYDRFGPVARNWRRPDPGENPFGDERGGAGADITIVRGKNGVRFGLEREERRAAALSFTE